MSAASHKRADRRGPSADLADLAASLPVVHSSAVPDLVAPPPVAPADDGSQDFIDLDALVEGMLDGTIEPVAIEVNGDAPAPSVVPEEAPQTRTPTPDASDEFYDFFKGDDPLILTIQELSAILVWGANNDVSDTYVASGIPLTVQRHGRLVKLMRRRLEVNEVMDLLGKIKPNSEATLLAGSPVDTRYDFAPSRARRYGFRVNATRGLERTGGDKAVEIVLRTIPYDIRTMEDLGIEQPIVDACFPKDGLVLVVGVTGSGKSTLLAGMLKKGLLDSDLRLLTYEAPPEFPLVAIPNMKGMVFQCEVGVHVSSFAEGIRNALRRKPDRILIGEARDRETIEMTIRAAETGHTVYSTVHTRGVLNTIERMADEFPIDGRWSVKAKLVDAMRLIVFQRLLPSTDGKRVALREYMTFPSQFREEVLRGGPENFGRLMKEGMAKHGRSLAQAAQELYRAGRIHERDLLEIQETGDAI